MLYQREINDPVLIQFIILYTLNQAKDYVPYNNLINLVLDNCNINFQDFQVALDNLEHTHHVKTFLESEHNEKYKITKKGMNASDLYTPNIPVYIKEPIDNSINELLNTEKVRNSVRSKITPIRKNEYSVECELYDDDDTNLLKLSLYAGSREEAERMAVYFKNEPNIVYETILTAFNEELHHISED